jgi:hypothetical protein
LNPGFGVIRNNTPVVFTKGDRQSFPILGFAIREGEPYQRADIQLQQVLIADVANINTLNSGLYYWKLLLNPTIGGTVPAYTNVGKCTRQWAYTNATTVSGGIELLSGYMSSSVSEDTKTALNFLNLGSNLEYTDSDKIVLVVEELAEGTSGAQIVASLNIVEDL